tara:strand:+ start:2554 stop:3600 length:1047 start_codon:yes stop_codon:yes gene_type:complete
MNHASRLSSGLLALLTLLPAFSTADPAEDFAAHCQKLGLESREAGKPSTQGEDRDWFFLTSELLHAGTGQFWTRDWAEVAINKQDPVPFMVQFQDLLQARGIELLVVPIPAKTSIHPDKVSSKFGVDAPYPAKPFLDQLTSAGLTCLDLEPVFKAERAAGNKMHCEQDAHFTPHACAVISKLIAQRYQDADWFTPQPESGFLRSEGKDLIIIGDQVPEDQRSKFTEVLDVQYCGTNQGGKLAPVPPSDQSPILLLGDSHTLVFQEGSSRGMHCKGAGLLDNLQVDCGLAIDQVGVRGSGMKAARVQLYRHAAGKPGYWDHKKLVIWTFSIREFTQSFDKLMEIPIERK